MADATGRGARPIGGDDSPRTTGPDGGHHERRDVDAAPEHDDRRGRRGALRDRGRAHDTDAPPVEGRATVVARGKDEHGGLKIGCAFFGWLSATGLTVLLTGIAAAAGAAFGVANDTSQDEARGAADTIGIVGGIVLLVIVLIAYVAGGYVAGRMARFNGLLQGLGVWLWTIVFAIVAAVVGAIAGSEYNVLDRLDSFPRIPVSTDELTTGGIVALVAVVVVSLVGALLGGLAGMRFHRRVDRTGLGR